MTKGPKTLLAATAIVASIIILVVVISIGLTRVLADLRKGDLIETSVSPEGRWKVRTYYSDLAGAMGSPTIYAKVTDLKGKVPAHKIFLSRGRMRKGIYWNNANVANVHGFETNVLTGFVLKKKTVSPKRGWQVLVYYVSPAEKLRQGRLENYYVVEVTDLKEAAPPRKIIINNDKIRAAEIRWKNGNTISIYGVVIDLRIAGRGSQQRIVADKRTPDVLTFKELLTKSEAWDRAQATLFWLLRAIF